MRRYLIDTTPLAGLVQDRPVFVSRLTPFIRSNEAATSVLVYAEVTEYLKGFTDFPVRHAQLQTLLRAVHPYFLTYPILDRYGDIRRALRPGNRLIGDIDTLIAATALERNLTLVTTDTDFQRVPSLSLIVLPR
jgi:predicted nucleic acid-binding protein